MDPKKSGNEENAKFTDLESQSHSSQRESANQETDSAPSSYSVSGALGSLFDTTRRVAVFGFHTAYDVTNATIRRIRGNENNVVSENTSHSNNPNTETDDEEKVPTTVTAVAIEEPIVLTAERVETLPLPQSGLSMN